MIGVIYTIYFLDHCPEQSMFKPSGVHNGFSMHSTIDDVVNLFPDFNKRLRNIGIENAL